MVLVAAIDADAPTAPVIYLASPTTGTNSAAGGNKPGPGANIRSKDKTSRRRFAVSI
jgi:hypothetical protein